MRILFIINTLAMGGAERVGSILCNAWAAQGHEIVLVQTYSGGGCNFFQVAPSIRQEMLGCQVGRRSFFDILRRIARLRRLARDFEPDVVVSFLTSVNLLTLAATSGLGLRRIIAERTDPVCMPLPGIMRWGCRLLYRFADMVIVQNNQQGARLESLYGRMPRLTAIANPLPEHLPEQGRRRADEPFRLISLGRLDPGKRIDMIITAFQRLAPDRPDWELHIFGDGPDLARLEKQARSGHEAARIHFKGRTDKALHVLADADIYASASTFEGFPNALMEAMAVGLPTLSTDCPCGPREMTDHGKAGLLVPVNDEQAFTEALAQLMDDATLRRLLGERAATQIRTLCSQDVVLEQWHQAFAQLGAK